MSLLEILRLKSKEHISLKKCLKSWLNGKEENTGKIMNMSVDQQEVVIIKWLIETKEEGEILLRFKDKQETYEVNFKKYQTIRVNMPYVISRDDSYVMYEWKVEDDREKMNKSSIETARQQADRINEERQEIFDTLFGSQSKLTDELYDLITEFLQGEANQLLM